MSGPIATCFLILALGADPLSDAAKKELKKLEGEWIVKSIENSEGKQDAGDELITLTFAGTKVSAFPWNQDSEIVALDPTANPKTVDMKVVRKGREDIIGEGIYKINGDTLVLVTYQGKDKKRPTSFDKPTEDKTIIWNCQRAKK